MKKLTLFTLFISTLLFANPNVFPSLGDTIYDNAPKIEKLGKIKEYEPFYGKISSYIQAVNFAKIEGYAIEAKKSNKIKNYLNTLRKLARTNDFFVKNTDTMYKRAMSEKNGLLFTKLVDTGMIDTKRNKKEILSFYYANKNDTPLFGTLETMVNANEKNKTTKHTREYYEKLRKQKEAQKIKRLRERDKKRQEKLQKHLEEELKIKKDNIRKEQLKELKKDI